MLFVASAFIALLLFNLLRLLTGAVARGAPGWSDWQIGLIRPFYFFVVFVDGLTASFLPLYVQGLAKAAQAPAGLVSTVFTVYFAAFVLALIPAGRFAERRGVKPLLVVGSALCALALVLMALVPSFYAMYPIRALAGLGQGILYIGVQSYILEAAVGGQKTRGAAIVVFGYNGGMISGTAIGALLAVYMGNYGVFLVGAVLAMLLVWYAAALLPRLDHDRSGPAQGVLAGLATAVRDWQFVKTIILIGIPAKAILTGVTIFALPLLLARQQYAQEDIGQILMLYAAGVLVSSTYVARAVDRLGRTGLVLFLGSLGSGLGLVLIGLIGWPLLQQSTVPSLRTVVLIAGMLLLGVAHGCIHAPIVTHISNTAAAAALGKSSTASLYRFLERVGHMAGPLIVSQLLLASHDSPVALGWLGGLLIVFGLLFVLRVGPPSLSAPSLEQL